MPNLSFSLPKLLRKENRFSSDDEEGRLNKGEGVGDISLVGILVLIEGGGGGGGFLRGEGLKGGGGGGDLREEE